MTSKYGPATSSTLLLPRQGVRNLKRKQEAVWEHPTGRFKISVPRQPNTSLAEAEIIELRSRRRQAKRAKMIRMKNAS